jgi:uncharacterized protein YjbJ (UPF0337 family)
MGMSETDKLTGRVKKAAGDLADDDKLRREGQKDETKGKVKEKVDDAVDKVAEMGRER